MPLIRSRRFQRRGVLRVFWLRFKEAAPVKPEDLENRIAQARAQTERHASASSQGGADPGIESAMSFGLRAGSQFVAAVLLGGGLGWAIDRWLGTRPFGMLVLMVLMFVAAMANVWRSMSKAVDAATDAAPSVERQAAAQDEVTDRIDGKPP
jgi:ATP synthase protein I